RPAGGRPLPRTACPSLSFRPRDVRLTRTSPVRESVAHGGPFVPAIIESMADPIPPAAPSKPSKPERLIALWPEIRALVLPRRGLLAGGFVLMAVNRVSGLVLPSSTKFLIDDVVGKRRFELLTPLVLAVLAATLVQGVTSFSLTQLLSKAAQRLI